ncbi:MAG: hypothetical protein AB7H97_20925 [Pseudobdellovibrionaceae bacterium]
MFLFSILLSQAVHATAVPCTLEQLLQNPKSECASQFARKIKDEKVRAEFKARLAKWSPPKGLKIYSANGFIEAQANGKTIARAAWLRSQNPAILWMNGKIITHAEDTVALAGRLHETMRAPAADDTARDLVFFYSATDADNATWILDAKTAQDTVLAKAPLDQYLPEPNPLSWVFGGLGRKCESNNTVGEEVIQLNPGSAKMELTITPKSPTEFIISGIESRKTHYLTITALELRMDNRVKKILHPKYSFEGAVLAECVDSSCTKTVNSVSYQTRELFYGVSAEEAKKRAEQRDRKHQALLDEENQRRRDMLGSRIYGLSIMGSCCADEICREEMKKNYTLRLTPSSH